MEAASAPSANFEIRVPADLENGTYSNFVSVWHSPFEFNLDFAVTQPGVPGEDGQPVRVPCNVVSRVKIPTSVIFSLMQALNDQMGKYEARFGKITPPQPPQADQ